MNQFVWTDLSTFDARAARKDYAALFGWSFTGRAGYKFALLQGSPVAAIFPMPKRLVEINMPSFWMSYVHVENVDISVAKARRHNGVIIEIEPTPFDEAARIALVRDPSGAGFTLYEGPEISSADSARSVGEVVERFHHVPDIGLIEPFYRDIFGWQFDLQADKPWPAYTVRDQDGTPVAIAEEVPESIRGKFCYWMPCFSFASLEKTMGTLTKHNGEVSSDLGNNRFLVADRQGAHFMIQLSESKENGRSENTP